MKEKSVTDTTGYRYSLRTLMLAVTLAAVTLSSVAVVGTPVVAVLTLYLPFLLAVRIKRGFEQGFPVAMVVTGLLAACPFVYATLGVSLLFLPMAWAAFLVGLVAGFYCFLLVHAIFCYWEGERFNQHETAMRPGDDDAGRPTDDVSESPER